MGFDDSQWLDASSAVRPGADHTDALLDEALRQTFPASDPVAVCFRGAPERRPDSPAARSQAALATNSRSADRAADGTNPSVRVNSLLESARGRLVTIPDDAFLVDAARRLRVGVDLIVVCNSDGVLCGVVTKTDVVSRIGQCAGSACVEAASTAMARAVVLCTVDDRLHDVWSEMRRRGLKNVPIGDARRRPLGILNARDALAVLLQQVKDEESLLRDYVMGVGYH